MVESEMNIRAATSDDAMGIAAVHVASWQETYVGLMPAAILNSLSVADRAARWARILAEAAHEGGMSVFVAMHAGDTVGFAHSCGQRDGRLNVRGFTGEIGAIYVLRNAQGKGLGRCLMTAAAQSLHELGHDAASLWVLRDNDPARRFYERLGGEVCCEREDRLEAATLVELAYGWRDLSALTGRSSRKTSIKTIESGC